MMRIPIKLPVGSHRISSRVANGSRLVNMYAEIAPGDSKAGVVLVNTPGTTLFCELPTSPILGLHTMNGILYAFTPNRMYSISQYGSYTMIGKIDIVGKISSSDDGEYLVFVDGVKGFYYSVEGGIKEFSGDGWYPSASVTNQDGYFIFNRVGTGEFFITKLLSVDLDPLDYATAEGAPDNVEAIISDHREVWLFGEQSTEVWYNSGNPEFPFSRINGVFFEIGIASSLAVSKVDNTIFWLGSDGVVYRANGYTPQRISGHSVEHDISSGNIADAFSYSYKDRGHSFYVLTFPSQNKTWCFDAATGEWHERSHILWGRHHANCHAVAYGADLVGDWQNGIIYSLDSMQYSDDGDAIRRVIVFPEISSDRTRMFMKSVELDIECGVGGISGDSVDPKAMLRWSDDSGRTWSNEKWASMGKIGEYLTRVKWNRLGMFRQRRLEVVITDKVKVSVIAAFAEVENGSN